MNAIPFLLWLNGAPGLTTAEPQFAPTLTPFLVAGEGARGAVIVFPGGGYGGRAPHEADPIAAMFNSHGIHAFVCHYRVAPYRHPHPMLDAQRAVRTVRHNAAAWSIKPDKIAVLGFSAGGHLASTVGTHFDGGDPDAVDPVDRESCRPDAQVLCYPVISFGPQGHRGSMVNLIGENPPEELFRSLCNETQVTDKTPPAFLWHTADDEGVPVENSLMFAEGLGAHKIPFELHVYEHGPHGMGLATDDPHVGTWPKLCADWLKGRGF